MKSCIIIEIFFQSEGIICKFGDYHLTKFWRPWVEWSSLTKWEVLGWHGVTSGKGRKEEEKKLFGSSCENMNNCYDNFLVKQDPDCSDCSVVSNYLWTLFNDIIK